METAAFLVALKRRVATELPQYPITSARAFLEAYGDTAEGQGLRRVIITINCGRGCFSECDVWLFSQRTTAVAVALIEARLDGRYSEEEWHRACSM